MKPRQSFDAASLWTPDVDPSLRRLGAAYRLLLVQKNRKGELLFLSSTVALRFYDFARNGM